MFLLTYFGKVKFVFINISREGIVIWRDWLNVSHMRLHRVKFTFKKLSLRVVKKSENNLVFDICSFVNVSPLIPLPHMMGNDCHSDFFAEFNQLQSKIFL